MQTHEKHLHSSYGIYERYDIFFIQRKLLLLQSVGVRMNCGVIQNWHRTTCLETPSVQIHNVDKIDCSNNGDNTFGFVQWIFFESWQFASKWNSFPHVYRCVNMKCQRPVATVIENVHVHVIHFKGTVPQHPRIASGWVKFGQMSWF